MTSLARKLRKPRTSFRTFKSVESRLLQIHMIPSYHCQEKKPESYVIRTHTETSYDVQYITYDQHLKLTPITFHHHREYPHSYS